MGFDDSGNTKGGVGDGGEEGDALGDLDAVSDAGLLVDATANGHDSDPGYDKLPPLPPLDRSTNIQALSPAQLGQLCDWMASGFGGYDVVTQCGNASAKTPADQAQCIKGTFTTRCRITVGDYEDCVAAEKDGNLCGLPSVCKILLTC